MDRNTARQKYEEQHKKTVELSSRLSDISANAHEGPRHIAKYRRELKTDIEKSEKLLEDLSNYLKVLKKKVDDVA